MKRSSLLIHSLLLACAASTVTAGASAQGDVDKPLPNVMLLVDTSGSMEWTADGPQFPVCNPGNPNAPNEKSRWIDLVEVMTGSFGGYSCFPMDRSSPAFVNEYSLDGIKPYDWGYVNPYHRIISNNCTVGPGVLPPSSRPWAFPQEAVTTFGFRPPNEVQRPGNLLGYTGCSNFSQAPDGVLDIFQEKVRFGLMTFDSHVHQGTGLAVNGVDFQDGVDGTWSYYLNDSPQQGRPANCATDQMQELGARNAAAPPWEGRMVAFGAPNATGSEIEQRNNQIQQVLLSTRPYGATPIAAMLHDARQFFWFDTTKDKVDQSTNPPDFGPYNDPTTKAPECRRNLIIMLSDGEPNLDLRPFCENSEAGGKCPYPRPEETAWELLHNPPNDPDQVVETVVIGFALDKVTIGGETVGCSALTDDHCRDNLNDRAIQACCTLNRIAAAGGRPNDDGTARRAYFPENRKELRRTFSRILSDITTSLTTRTSAAFASAGSSAKDGSHQFSSSFTPVLEQPWRGNLTRTRILCDDGVPVEQPVDDSKGDDFAANLNSGVGAPRRFLTVIPEGSTSNTIRPALLSNVDGIEVLNGTQTAAMAASEFASEVSPEHMAVDAADCEGNTAQACRDAILRWTVGLSNAEDEHRCRVPGSSDCNLFGAIYHSTPKIVSGRPTEFLRDESYQAFAEERVASGRPSVLYTSTADGMLHAFKTADQSPEPEKQVNRKSNNELWAFFPPAVLPVLQAQYPHTPATLLDSKPIIKDVPARINGNSVQLERTFAQASAGLGSWRTALVQGFGKGLVGSGYFALDVTSPDPGDDGPRFLWQLTRDHDGLELFGSGGVPLITQVFLKPSSTDPGTEVAVAVLPGGDGGSRTGDVAPAGPLMAPESEDFAPQEEVNLYAGGVEARSLTIVRLDTGEILRTFRAEEHPNILTSRTTIVDIPAPIVGQPAAFPASPGAVADRIFVGDRDGRIWRLDVSSNDPRDWDFKVFFDAYFDQPIDKRQPIETPPVISVDQIGQITVAASTGEQRVQTADPGQINRVVSLTEQLNADNAFEAKVNWVQTLGCDGECGDDEHEGERVTGPMTLFGQSLYFASSVPAEANSISCGVGLARVWGVHYILSRDEAREAQFIDPMNGPNGALPIPLNSSIAPKSTPLEPGIVFGVSIEQQPTCSTETEEFSGDPYLGGYGEHTSINSVNPGKFQLVYQLGGVTTSSKNKVTTTKVELDPPPNSVRIDSWAPIFE